MKRRLYYVLVSALLLLFLMAACSMKQAGGSIIVTSKQFTENILLSEMYAQLIESHTDLEVIRKQDMGSTAVCFAALENGEADIYVEYTGTLYNELLGYEYDQDITEEVLYDTVKREMNDKKSITVCRPIGLNNTYALAMLRTKAETMGVSAMSDLSAAAPKLVFAANSLYYTRTKDGYTAMTEKYELRFKSAVRINSTMLFSAAQDDQVDVIVVYATDSLLAKFDMIILEDDKRMFPDYYALPVIRNDALEKYPELNDVLDMLENSIDNELMQELNYLVDIDNKSPAEVAKAFLEERGLLNN